MDDWDEVETRVTVKVGPVTLFIVVVAGTATDPWLIVTEPDAFVIVIPPEP